MRSAITAHLAPVLVQEGFLRHRPKHFVRVRGELIDSIAFQVSTYGSKVFYVHYSVNLLADPVLDIDGYWIGNRLQASHVADGISWEGATQASADAALQSVAATAKALMLPWLDSVVGPRDYVYEYVANPNTVLESLQLAVALLLSGDTDRPWWICESLRDPAHYDDAPEDFEIRQMQQAAELQQQIDNRAYADLLGDWKNKNRESLGFNS